jgi:hypothetical protein
MIRWMSVVVAVCAATGCSGNSTDPVSQVSPPETVLKGPSPDVFAGAWRSVTPSLEFIGLSVASKSSEMGVLAARLTFSGVAWEGAGRIEGDSLMARMAIVGAATPTAVMVVRARDARTLRVRMRGAAASATDLDLTFVREN